MKKLIHFPLTLALCAVALPALAQTETTPQPIAVTPTIAPLAGPVATAPSTGGWGDEAFERQDLREEMEQIRKEHEEVEVETDALIDKCVKPGAAADMCEKEKQALKDRRLKLHDRRQALRDRIDMARKDHPPSFAMPHGMIPLSQPAPVAPAAPVTGSTTPQAAPMPPPVNVQ